MIVSPRRWKLEDYLNLILTISNIRQCCIYLYYNFLSTWRLEIQPPELLPLEIPIKCKLLLRASRIKIKNEEIIFWKIHTSSNIPHFLLMMSSSMLSCAIFYDFIILKICLPICVDFILSSLYSLCKFLFSNFTVDCWYSRNIFIFLNHWQAKTEVSFLVKIFIEIIIWMFIKLCKTPCKIPPTSLFHTDLVLAPLWNISAWGW